MQSEYATSMFPDNIATSKHNVIFVCAFSLGVPLSLCPTSTDSGWAELSKQLRDRLSHHPLFEVVPIKHHPETLFPLGTPVTIRCSHFFEVFDIERFQSREGVLPQDHTLDHVIWICPTGTILIIGKVSSSDEQPIDLHLLNELEFESHYPALGFVFNEVAEAIFDTVPSEFLRPPMCCERDVQRIGEGIALRNMYNLSEFSGPMILEWLASHADAAQLFEDQVVDVYFIDYRADKNQGTQVDYFSATVESCDPTYVLMTTITYSSFACLVWLVRHLGEQVTILQTELSSELRFKAHISQELKLLRIFCLRFISESNPIQIRLKAEYMQCLEAGWEPYRLYKLIAQVNEQLTTLESIAGWIDDNARANRDRKLSIAAVVLSIVSITAVAAQLVSTLDVHSQLGQMERLLFVLLGLVVGGILSILVIFLLPLSKPRHITRSS